MYLIRNDCPPGSALHDLLNIATNLQRNLPWPRRSRTNIKCEILISHSLVDEDTSFKDITPCMLVYTYWHFGGAYGAHLPGSRRLLCPCSQQA